MADIDDRRALGRERADDGAELPDAVEVERRGRLVEQQHLRVADQRLDDFEELPLGRRQLADERVGRDAEIVGGELLSAQPFIAPI